MIRAALRFPILSALLWPPLALAQAVTVIGPVTPGNVPQFNSTTIIKDSGIPASALIGCTAAGAFSVGTGSGVQCSNIAGSTAVLNGGPLTITPAPLSNIAGIGVTQSTPNGGSVAGPIRLNAINVTDGTQAVTGTTDSLGQIANRTDAFSVNDTITGGSANHFGINSMLNVNATQGGAIAVGAGIKTNSGSTITGNQWAVDAFILVGSGSTLNQVGTGVLSEVGGSSSGAAITSRVAFNASSFGQMPVGSNIDAAYTISVDAAGSPPYDGGHGFTNGVYFSSNLSGAATFPITSGGNMFLADTGTVTNIFNFANVTATGNILSAQNLLITGAGSAAFGIGSSATANSISVRCSTCGLASGTASANGTAGFDGFQAQDSSANNNMFLGVLEASNTLTRFGQTAGNWGSINVSGSTNLGLLFGTVSNQPLIIGTNNTARLTFSAAGVPTFFENIVFSPTTAGITGTTTNDSACAGCVGEYVQSQTSLTASATVTISNASPAVITETAHGMTAALNNCSATNFTTTGGLPTGLTVGTNYYVNITGVNTYNVSTSVANCIAGTFVNTSSAGSGTHTAVHKAILASTTEISIAGFALGAGDWDVTCAGVFGYGSTTNVTTQAVGATTTSGTFSANPLSLSSFQFGSAGNVPGALNFTQGCGPWRLSLSGTTNVFADQLGIFTVSTLSGAGGLRARRMH